MPSIYDYRSMNPNQYVPGQMGSGSYGVSTLPPRVDPGLFSPQQKFNKNTMDGTNSFGANSVPGAWGDWGYASQPNAAMSAPLPMNDPVNVISPLTKQALDGTNIFGANSVPGAFGDWGSNALSSAPTGGPLSFLRDSGFLGSRDQQGWGGLALGAAQGLGSLYMGMQQYNLAKDTLENSKAQFERNYEAQKTTTNSSLEDRQKARVASNAGAYESVGSYMQRNGVK